MRTRSSSNLPVDSSPRPTSSNPKRRNRRRSKQPFILEEYPVDTMTDQRTMAELLRAPTKGYAEAIVQRFNESFHEAWDRYKNLLHACPHHGFTKLHQLDTLHNALNPADQDSLNSAAGGKLLERRTQDVLTIIKNKSKIAKLTHAVNQQTSVVTTAMTVILKQFQATPPPASCLAADGNTFSELRDNIQGYVLAAAINYNQDLSLVTPLLTQKAITTRSGIVLDGPSVPMPPQFINPEEDEHVEETLTDQDLAEYTIKVPPPLLHINITLADALILILKYHKMLKALLSNKKKLLELANTPLNENCSAVIFKKLPEKLRDLGKFLIPCGFSELKCKALANLDASINLMPLSVWKKLGLLELIFTRMTLELANRAICTPDGIARDSPLILGRPFLQTARALIDVYGEEMILRDGDERLTLNMRHDTSSYSNQPQKESINMINIFNDPCEDFLEDLFTTNHQSGNPTFSSHPNLTSSKVKDDIFDPEGDMVLIEKLINLDSTKDLSPPHNINPLSGSTTSFSPNHLPEEFADELALITFPSGNDDLPFDIESDLKEIEYLLNHDPIKEMDSILEDSVDKDNLADLNDNLVDTMPEMFTDEHAFDYSSPPLYDEYDDDLFEVESDTEYVYNDPFDSKGEKIKESKLLIDELDLPRSSDFLPSPEYDSFLFEDFFEVDALPSIDNEDKVFNPGILIQENLFEVTTHVTSDKNIKKIAQSHASLVLEDFDPPLYELPFQK
nr:hypothetical protein [Tanacetum cinerariifolium]